MHEYETNELCARHCPRFGFFGITVLVFKSDFVAVIFDDVVFADDTSI